MQAATATDTKQQPVHARVLAKLKVISSLLQVLMELLELVDDIFQELHLSTHAGYNANAPEEDTQKEIALGRPLYVWEKLNAPLIGFLYCKSMFSDTKIATHQEAMESLRYSWSVLHHSGAKRLNEEAHSGNLVAVAMKCYGLEEE
jgi:hypothetical protein